MSVCLFVVIPLEHVGIVERLGRYRRTMAPGLRVIVPLVDDVKAVLRVAPHDVVVGPTPIIGADDRVREVTARLLVRVEDPVRATYETDGEPFERRLETAALHAMRSTFATVPSLEFDAHLERVVQRLRSMLDAEGQRFGVRVDAVDVAT